MLYMTDYSNTHSITQCTTANINAKTDAFESTSPDGSMQFILNDHQKQAKQLSVATMVLAALGLVSQFARARDD